MADQASALCELPVEAGHMCGSRSIDFISYYQRSSILDLYYGILMHWIGSWLYYGSTGSWHIYDLCLRYDFINAIYDLHACQDTWL